MPYPARGPTPGRVEAYTGIDYTEILYRPQGAWKPCAKALGIRFGVWDVNDGVGLLGKTGGWESIDLAVISYVYYHYMSSEHCADWLARLLNSGAIKAVLIISRFEDLSPQARASGVSRLSSSHRIPQLHTSTLHTVRVI